MYSEKPALHKRQKEYQPGSLRTIAMDVTPKCNMTCHHCYAETFAQAKPIGLKRLQGALDEFHDLGVFHYVLQGGEPIADPERLESILNMCRPQESYINVVTNGWLMTRENIEWLKSLHVDKIAFSLDSGIESEHDAGRQAGSYKRVLAAIDHVLDVGLLASVSIVVTHRSLYSEGFRRAYDYAKNKGIRLDVQIAEPVGKWDGKKELLMTPADSATIKRLQQHGPRLKNGQRFINRDIYSGEQDHCPAGTEFMGLSADGQLLPCNFLQFSLGRVGERSIKRMRQDLLGQRKWFNGRYPRCLCGEDDEFIATYMMPTIGQPKPLDAYQVFNLVGQRRRCG